MSKIIGMLMTKLSHLKKASAGEPWKVIDTFQQYQTHSLMTEYDMNPEGREKSLWEEALDVIRTTSMAERTIRYITLNRPEPETVSAATDEIQQPAEAILRNLVLPDPVSRPVRPGNEPPQKMSPHTPYGPEMEWPE